jgi:hypothetical protein
MGKTEIVIGLAIVGGLLFNAVHDKRVRVLEAESLYNSMTAGIEKAYVYDTEREIAEYDGPDLLRYREAKSYTKASQFLNAQWVYEEKYDRFTKSLYASWTPERSILTFNNQYQITWPNTVTEPLYMDTVATFNPTGIEKHFQENSGYLDSIMSEAIPLLASYDPRPETGIYENQRLVELTASGIEWDTKTIDNLVGVSEILQLPSPKD